MMNNSSIFNEVIDNEIKLIHHLKYVTDSVNRYVSPIIWLFGVTGNILNCLVLCQRTLRSNSCALLFLISSFVDLISILVGLTTRILAGWHIDPTSTITWLCRTRAFIVFITRTFAIWLITLATIDRWLLSSVDVQRRRMSSLKNVKRGTILIMILSVLFYVHMLICYEANLHDKPLPCYGSTVQCRLITDLIYSLITVTLPLALMLVFGLLTILNVRDLHRRVHSVARDTQTGNSNNPRDAQAKRVDRHMLRMLFVQMILLFVLCMPQAVQKFHITAHPYGLGKRLDDELRTFTYNIEIQLTFMASGMPFYIYTLAGGVVFRKALMDLLRSIVQKLKLQTR